MYSLTTTSPAASAPVSLAVLKEHGTINAGDSDATLQIYLDAAVQALTEWTGYVPVSTTFRLDVDADHWACAQSAYVVALPRWPVTTVSQVEARQADGTYSTISSTYYRLVGDRSLYIDQSAIVPSNGISPSGLRITFVAAGSSSAAVKLAILQLAAVSYRYREASTEIRLSDVPFACRAILEGLKGGDL